MNVCKDAYLLVGRLLLPAFYFCLMLITLTTSHIFSEDGTWFSYGTLGSGNIGKIIINPQNPAILYFGTSEGIIFKSTNEGMTWSTVSLGLSSDVRVQVLSIDPQNPATIYAGIINNHSTQTIPQIIK